MSLNVRQAYAFDDLLLIPKHSTVSSRKEVDLCVNLGKDIILNIPIISANMKNVTGYEMSLAIAELGGLALIHRFYNNQILDQLHVFQKCVSVNKNYINNIGVSIGIQKYDLDNLSTFISNGVKIICLDIAHADCDRAVKAVKDIKNKYKNILLIAGNVATFSGFHNLAEAGADVIKVGIGNGSSCLTRVNTGNGVPQLSALSEVYEYQKTNYPNVKIIADGGIRRGSDLIKSLCFSHAAMLGNFLAGSDEAPGDIVIIDDKKYKTYAGSSTFKKENIEGVSALVPVKGPVKNVVEQLLQGLRSGCSYQNAHNLDELKKDPRFSLMTQNGLVESGAHSVFIKS